MNLETSGRVIKLGLTNFWRNWWLSVAATLIMTLTLIIISVFLIMSLLIGKTADSIRSKMDITVYFNDAASSENIADLQKQIVDRTDVKEVKYISKEEALAIFQEQQKGKKVSELIDPNENPLPRSLEIKAQEAENLNQIADFINEKQFSPIIHNVSYKENQVVIERLIGVTSFLKKTGWIFSGIFILISILVILNTIRLTIINRKDEIEIMRLVGASDNFIKVPFIVEGFLYGFIATILATIFLRIGVWILSPMMEKYLGIDLSHKLINFFSGNFLLIIGLELFVGIAIGIGCSLISIRKHLKV